MAKKKATEDVTETALEIEATETEQSAEELKAILDKLKAEKDALLAELEEAKAQPQTQNPVPEGELRVPVFVPLIPGDDPDQVVTVNGETIKFKKGVWVQVHPKFKQVIDNMMEQENAAAANRERLRMQGQDL